MQQPLPHLASPTSSSPLSCRDLAAHQRTRTAVASSPNHPEPAGSTTRPVNQLSSTDPRPSRQSEAATTLSLSGCDVTPASLEAIIGDPTNPSTPDSVAAPPSRQNCSTRRHGRHNERVDTPPAASGICDTARSAVARHSSSSPETPVRSQPRRQSLQSRQHTRSHLPAASAPEARVALQEER